MASVLFRYWCHLNILTVLLDARLSMQ
uniref:Uncharacterized protein n=1 Tax=Anguilla anguilla TaxID=7936 RepID=A0A0E9SY54_ANGAN